MLAIALMAMVATGAMAQDKAENSKKPVFTTIKELPITSIKDQNRSGTCWAYSTLSFFESEILKATGKSVDLCEMFVCNKDYMERAILTVRMHGDSQFAQGGSAGDVLDIIKRHGICPDNVAAVAKSSAKKISNQWKPGLQGILDAYLGECPTEFVYEGKKYTPMSFAQSLGVNWDDYVSITSYTHHPFYTAFPVEVQDNWRWDRSYNVPMDEMMRIIDNALANGYTIAWGGDVSEEGFTRKGLGIAYDTKAAQSLTGSDAAKLGAHRRPRYAHLRSGQGPKWQGVLHGEELMG